VRQHAAYAGCFVFDLDAYLARIGADDEQGLATIHRAHATSIPFENLDPLRGVAPALHSEALERKLVAGRRGGYCFEHNLLLAEALGAVGATVDPMLARVRWHAPAGTVRALNHLVLRVSLGGEESHADVGFGAGGLLEPIPFGPGGPYEQAGWRFRVVSEQGVLVLQTETDGDWEDIYAFVPEPAPRIDIEVNNWYTATNPDSAFVSGLIVARLDGDGTRTVLSDFGELALIVTTPGSKRVTPVDREQIPRLLSEQFDLPGFALNGAGRLVLEHERQHA